MEIFIIFLFQSSWISSFAVFVEFNLNVNCKETINICYENFHHISVAWSMDAFVHGICRIQFKCKLCKETITFIFENFYHISVAEFLDAFLYGICRNQFKCKLCKDYNICYESFHHISVAEFMDAFFYGIYKNKFKCKLCIETITFILKIFIIFHVPEFMDDFLYSFQFKFKLCKDNNICYGNFHHISVAEFKDAFFMVFIEFNLNVNCVKTITFVMKIFIIFLFQSSWMPSFMVFIEFNLNVNCVKRQ